MNHNLLEKKRKEKKGKEEKRKEKGGKRDNHHHFDPQFTSYTSLALVVIFDLTPYPGFCFCKVLVTSNDTIVKVWIGLAGQDEVFTNCDSVLPLLISQTPWNKLALIFLFTTYSRRI
jgi:hypothetical protein